MPVPGRGHPRDRPAAAIGGKVNLARQPTPRAPQRFPTGLGGRPPPLTSLQR
jgi:hypothetical protein